MVNIFIAVGLQKQSNRCKICKKNVHQKCIQYMPDCTGVSVCLSVCMLPYLCVWCCHGDVCCLATGKKRELCKSEASQTI